MIGEVGIALTNLNPSGQVRVHGEIWQARSDTPIEKDQPVKVLAVSGLQVNVEKLNG
jgi:membrane-bound serine protease (ClpP class)